RFIAGIRREAPTLARVDELSAEMVRPRGERAFRIEASQAGPARAMVPADVATCDECLRELGDPDDRRHRYPFINCTQCAPRFTMVERVPYDGPNTTMSSFEMCERCRAEYEDPADRRFHAEPIACPDCGPGLRLGSATGDDALAVAVSLIRAGRIIAVKGL